jgi:hypothetical protein
VTRAVVVTARWGPGHGESGLIVRLLAGALSLHAHVEVVSLCTGTEMPLGASVRTRRDSVFAVHEIPAARAEPQRAGLLRAALAQGHGDRLPEVAGGRLVELGGGPTRRAAELVASLRAGAVVLAGPETWWLPEALGSGAATSRIVSVPLLGDDAKADLSRFDPLFFKVDGVGVLSGAEARRVANRGSSQQAAAGAQMPACTELELALPLNRPAAAQLMVGMSHFGRFVALLTGFPEDAPGALRSPGHDYVRRALGPVAVAEVRHGRWSVSDRVKVREVPVGPSRANLWKLLSHAEVCLDLRPQGMLGRETLESLLLGTPVVVPEGTVAAEHAERSDGGLWYRDYGEMFDAAKAILDDASLRAALSSSGRSWAEEVHGDQDRFCEQVARFVFG